MHGFKTKAEVKVKTHELQDALLIFQNSHISVCSLYEVFEIARKKRGGDVRGMTTDQEQDVLRAMLIFACAGLDSTIKQVISDVLPTMVKISNNAQFNLEKYLERKIKVDSGVNTKYLSQVLASVSPHKEVVKSYIQELTGESLQSFSQLKKAWGALGLELAVNNENLEPIFRARNQIIHEMDIDLEGKTRKRTLRSKTKMVEWTDRILGISREIIETTDCLISQMPKRRFRVVANKTMISRWKSKKITPGRNS